MPRLMNQAVNRSVRVRISAVFRCQGCRDQLVRCHLERYLRSVCFVGGPVSERVPIFIHYRGRRGHRTALALAARIGSWGYQVKVRRDES